MTIDIDEILEFAKASGFSTDEEGNIYYDINEFESIDVTKELLATFRTYVDSVLLHSPSPKNWVSSTKNIPIPEHWKNPFSLRDHFAGLAMQGLVGKDNWDLEEFKQDPMRIAMWSYDIADEMLIEREKNYED